LPQASVLRQSASRFSNHCRTGRDRIRHRAAIATSQPNPKELLTMDASGPFDVKFEQQKIDNPQAQAAGIGRLSLDKQYHGVLAAVGKGEMLATGDGQKSGAYVAIERVTGTLQGRSGSFALVHHAVMNHGVPQSWSVTVVPDSGTEQLAGLSGTMTITIDGGKHFYDFHYTLPES
jgi:hypothetical protein